MKPAEIWTFPLVLEEGELVAREILSRYVPVEGHLPRFNQLEICYALQRLNVHYYGRGWVELYLFDRGPISGTATRWEVVKATVTWREDPNSQSVPLEETLEIKDLKRLKLRAPLCLDPVEGQVFVIWDSREKKAFLRLGNGPAYDHQTVESRFNFKSIEGFLNAQIKAKGQIVVVEEMKALQENKVKI